MEKKAIGKYFNVGITLFLMGIIFIAYVYEDYFFSDFTPLIMPIAKILLIFLFLTLLFWLILTDYSCHTLINLLDKLPVSLKDWLNNNPVYFILLLSGLFGFCMSLKISPYQPYVESGQVIAGIVNYPIDNPFYYYHHKLITLIKELAALFLYLGIPEKITGTILMAMVVTIGFQGISLAIFAISKQKLISVLSPFVLLYFFLDMRSYYIRINYAILFFDAYSGLSLSYTMLTLSLIALKKYKSGALLLGLSLAIHPTMGAWISFIGGLTLLWWYFSAKLVIKPYLKFYIIGFLLSSVYLFYHFYTTYAIKLPYASPEVIEQFFLATLEWSNHHRKFPLGDFITERGFILLIISFPPDIATCMP